MKHDIVFLAQSSQIREIKENNENGWMERLNIRNLNLICVCM